MTTSVYIVTGLDLGWDCIVGVYSTEKVSLESLQEAFNDDKYMIVDRDIDYELNPEFLS